MAQAISKPPRAAADDELQNADDDDDDSNEMGSWPTTGAAVRDNDYDRHRMGALQASHARAVVIRMRREQQQLVR